MGRALIAIVLIVALIAAVVMASRVMTTLQSRARQRQLARLAPDLLAYDTDFDPRIVAVIVDQRQKLAQGRAIVSMLLDDPVITLPTEYHQPLNQWLSNTKEIR